MSYNYPFTAQLTFIEVLKSFLFGMKMDMSMTGYFMLLFGILVSISSFKPSKVLFYTFHVFTLLLLLVAVLITTVDLELYRHWGFRMNTLPLFY
ncbi:MAG TPA: hypothetical protein VGK39_05480, partial [Cyclobacteriaceae bacterium]